MESGHFDESLKIAREQFQFKSLDEPGNLPLGIIINGHRYQLLTTKHPGICDNHVCQIEAQEKKSKKNCVSMYEESPLYSNFGNHELCVYCANVSNRQTFEPTFDESKRILEILGYNFDDSSYSESNVCDCDTDDCDCGDFETDIDIASDIDKMSLC